MRFFPDDTQACIFADQAWGAEAAWRILADILIDMRFVPRRGETKLSLYNANIGMPPVIEIHSGGMVDAIRAEKETGETCPNRAQ